ncbi:Uma2 family endonuclease [soil metagenome]
MIGDEIEALERHDAMSIATQTVSADELDQFPDDGKRREVIGGELHVSPAPSRTHQELSAHLLFLLYGAIVQPCAGMVYAAPVDVRFSGVDQVRPDLLAIRRERLGIYRGHTVHGAPDIVVEILSPSNPAYDEVEKRRLYAAGGVPEYWIVDPEARRMTILRLTGEEYHVVEPVDGNVRSESIVDFAIDPSELFARLTAE